MLGAVLRKASERFDSDLRSPIRSVIDIFQPNECADSNSSGAMIQMIGKVLIANPDE